VGRINVKRVLYAVISPLLIGSEFRAEEGVELEKFHLRIGSYALSRYDSAISMTDPDPGARASISPQHTLGADA
jgi:hypothetical protein